jgi:O-antigen/teichoic acid export membrane protein
MLNFGMKPEYSRIIVVSALLNNVILIPLCFWFKAPGAAASALIIEIFVTVTMAMMLFKNRRIDLLPRFSDMRGQLASLSFFAQRSYEKVRG